MKTIPIQLTIALLAGAAAAQEPQPPNNHRPPPPPPIFSIFDTDRDGVLSAREVRKASDALAALDRNGDRQITRDEFMPPPPEGGNGPKPPRPPGRRPQPPVIAALDTDKNGTLSAEELKAAPESLLELDANGDGELSPDELHPHGPPPPPEGGAPQQPE